MLDSEDEMVFIAGDLNCYVGKAEMDTKMCMLGFYFGERTREDERV